MSIRCTLNFVTVEVGIRELRSRLSDYLDRVKAGEEVVVTERGRPIVRMHAVGVPSRYEQLVAAGVITPPSKPRGPLPPPVPTKGGVLEFLDDELRKSRDR